MNKTKSIKIETNNTKNKSVNKH